MNIQFPWFASKIWFAGSTELQMGLAGKRSEILECIVLEIEWKPTTRSPDVKCRKVHHAKSNTLPLSVLVSKLVRYTYAGASFVLKLV